MATVARRILTLMVLAINPRGLPANLLRRALLRRAQTQAPSLQPPPPPLLSLKTWSGSLDDLASLILHEHDHLIALCKPPAVLTQPEQQASTDNLFAALRRRPHTPNDLHVIHRLDRPCSGVIVYAKSAQAAASLNAAFQARRTSKHYLCVVNGAFGDPAATTTLRHWIQKTNAERVKVFDRAGDTPPRKDVVDAALTATPLVHFNPPSRSNTTAATTQTVVHVALETGRKHQIRAQMAHIGHPIVGDTKYGAPQAFATRDIALHAWSLTVPHPVGKHNVTFTAPPPAVWAQRFGDAAIATALHEAEKRTR